MLLSFSSSRVLISSLVALALASVVLADVLTFTWPKYPEVAIEFSLTWSGGTPPVC